MTNSPFVQVIRSDEPLVWGALDLPLFGASSDWAGAPLERPVGWCLAVDPTRLWWLATHAAPARLHPASRPGRFQAELWRYDVAELFLAHPESGRYLELNLAPNGAWWSCEFTAPRLRAEEVEIAMPEVATFAELGPQGGWIAAMAIPLDLLRARIDFGEGTRGNLSFLLESPSQRAVSVADLGGGEPDFHRPAHFPELQFLDARLWQPPAGS